MSLLGGRVAAKWVWRFFLVCAGLAAAGESSGFHLDVTLGQWRVEATAQNLSVTWLPTGVVWHSQLVEVTPRARTLEEPCLGSTISKVHAEGVTRRGVLASAVRTSASSVLLAGTVPLPGEGGAVAELGSWSLSLSASMQGLLDFDLKVDNCTGNHSGQPRGGCRPAEGKCHPYRSTDVALLWALDDKEAIVGAGEQFSSFNLRGDKFDIWLREHGTGRGRQPISTIMDLTCPTMSGDKHTTYTHVPVFLSSRGYGLVLENSQLITADFTTDLARLVVSFEDRPLCETEGFQVAGHLLAGAGGVRSLLVPLTTVTGRMSAPAPWTQTGLVLGAEGGHEVVSQWLETVKAAGVPVAGLWMQDWPGIADHFVAKMVWWNWKLNETRYPKPWIRKLRSEGLRIMTYVNPFLTTQSNGGADPEVYLEAKRLGYLIVDSTGEPIVRVQFVGGQAGAQLNLFDARAVEWWQQLMRCNVMMACEGPNGTDSEPLVSGWMHDYGEYYPIDSRVKSSSFNHGVLASDVHNMFPRVSVIAARNVTADHSDVTFFARSGDLESPGSAKIFWLGDQMTTLDGCGGMQSALMAAMSSGVSGWTLTHMDVGGIVELAIPLPGGHFTRTPEELIRSLELAIFIGAMLRSHPGVNPSPANAQLWDSDVLPHTRRLSELFVALRPYRETLFKEAETLGLPLVRHGLLVFPDEGVWFNKTITRRPHSTYHCGAGYEIGLSQFFLGDHLLVVPVVDRAWTQVDVYFPAGQWVHFWTNKTVAGPSYTNWPAPLGQPAFFYRTDSVWAPFFRKLAGTFAPKPPSPVAVFV